MKEQIDKDELQEFVITLSDCQHKFDKEVNKAIVTGTPLPKENKFYARYLMEQGYRKQEWISVDERLPEKGKHVLCLYPQKDYGSKVVVDYAETADGFFAEQYLFGPPSHWMPLPEPPKMKGGAE